MAGRGPRCAGVGQPGTHNNLTHSFLAEGVTAGVATPDASEDIRVHLVPIAEVERLIDGGGFLQALHAAPLLKFLLQRRRQGGGK